MTSSSASSPAKVQPIQRPKGTQDILPAEAHLWQRVEGLAQTLFSAAGYGELRTPVIEHTELFKRGVGEETDIVNKEMYTFERSDRSFTLRPENTAGVVRAYIENGMSRWPKPVKLFYTGPMFRYERPQKGRQRQFHQLGIEVFGVSHPAVDAEVIALAWRLFTQLGLPQLALEINTIGDVAARNTFRDGLKQRLHPHLANLSETSRQRFETNPFRILDSKDPIDNAVLALPEVADYIANQWVSEESQAYFTQLCAILDGLSIPYTRNPRLVRGLDYYNDMVFEMTSTHLGAQNAVCGGGRYDVLMEQLGGPSTPGVGWALGMERLIALLPDQPQDGPDYYIVTDCHAEAFSLADTLRQAGKSAEVDLTGKGFGKQLEAASKRHARFVILLGQSEKANLARGEVVVKNLGSGQQELQPLSVIVS